MASERCMIQVHVRRTGEVISIDVIPSVTTYGDVINLICTRIEEPEPSHYYLTVNYESELENDMVFQLGQENQRFQMIMRTKWLIEYIAAQTLQKKRLTSEMKYGHVVDEPTTETPSTSIITDNEIPQTSTTTEDSIVPEQNREILGNIVRTTIERIPRRDVQKYLHKTLDKSFDILLMGSPRVGKSTLINAILKKDIARTSAGRNRCTVDINSYVYEETYTSSFNDSSLTSRCSIRIWDAPGVEDWKKLDVADYIQDIVKEKNPICLIYCASPGSYADIEHIETVIEQCRKLKLFIALVVTNMYASDEVDQILDTFKSLLVRHSKQTKAVDDVFYYGTIGLCTAVNSVEYEALGVTMKPAGIDKLMLGIMNSLSEEKLLQWCFALMDNGPFWIRAQSKIWKTFHVVKHWIGY